MQEDGGANLRVEGTVTSGGRVEVELFVGDERVAWVVQGDRVALTTADGEVDVDVSALSLADLAAETHRGTWSELERRPEAALVADRSPAPHVKASLVVRRLGPGASLAIEAVATAHGFDEATTNRAAVVRRVRAVRALKTRSKVAPAPAPREPRARWWLAIPWAVAGLVIAATAIALALAPNVKAALVSLAIVASILVVARFTHRALVGVPAMDEGLAHPFPRFFARAARSLPRFGGRDRDATRRVTTFLGPAAVLGWGYVVFMDVLYPLAVLHGDIRSADLAPTGSAAIVAGQAAALALFALGYLVADASELPRVRSLLAALDGGGAWRARLGTIAPGSEQDLLHRAVFVEGDSSSESTSFYAKNVEGGVERIEVRTERGVVVVPRAGLAWASDDVVSAARSDRMRVCEGAAAIVAGFEEGETLVARGPASMMVFTSVRGRPVVVLRGGMRARVVDAALAGLAAALLSAAAVAIYAP